MTDFFKYHALGNDYIVIDPNLTSIPMTQKNIQRICNRHFGIGSDGILYGPILDNHQINLRIFNPDGSEAEKSGNGLRIFARYLQDLGYVNSDEFQVWTVAGVNDIQIQNTNIQVNMGVPNFDSKLIPVSGRQREVINETVTIEQEKLVINCVSIGNPHCIIVCDTLSKLKLQKLGPIIENSPLFPNRINVQFMKVIDRANINIMIWERGAGYTLASGSSSTAAASVARKIGLVDNYIKVKMPGGALDISFDVLGSAYMKGPVEGITKGYFLDDFLNHIVFSKEE
jgi:diaminopimelate epimerase